MASVGAFLLGQNEEMSDVMDGSMACGHCRIPRLLRGSSGGVHHCPSSRHISRLATRIARHIRRVGAIGGTGDGARSVASYAYLCPAICCRNVAAFIWHALAEEGHSSCGRYYPLARRAGCLRGGNGAIAGAGAPRKTAP